MRRTSVGLAAVAVFGALAGTGAAQPQPVAGEAERCHAGGDLPAAWSDRRKVVQLAVCEWSKFGYPVVEIRPAPRAEANSLPSSLGLTAPLRAAAPPRRPGYDAVVPAVEVQTRFGRTESDPGASPAIEAYWSAVRPAYVDEMRRARQKVGKRAYYPGWWDPWSAAFTSWVLQTARIDWFSGAPSHVQYLKRAMTARPGELKRASRYRPLPGDLICAPRADANGQPTAVGEAEFIAALNSGVDHFETHCDIVVRVNKGSLVSIGGNVKNGVTATVTPLKGGRLLRTDQRPWSAALTLGEPYDPCARIESVDLRGWDGVAAERKRALARTGCRAP